MGSSFGERLRQERITRSLTQAELGGSLYSASYISLLENGKREPTAEIIRQLSKQLQMAPQSIEEWVQPSYPEESEYLLASLNARQCWDTRDYAAAVESAGKAAEQAKASRDTVTWWNMAYLQTNSLMRLGKCQDALDVSASLIRHPMTIASAALSMRTRQVMAAAMMGQGRLQEAIEQATMAVDLGAGDTEEEYSSYLAALQTLIGALTESGRLDEAWTHCRHLSDAISASTPAQAAGEMHWVIGNVAFIRQDIRMGLDHHAQASRLLSPAEDLARWAQFNKATAWVRLAAGIVEPETLLAIERSELAHSVVGSSPTEAMEMSLLRARWHFLNDEPDKALELLESPDFQTEELPAHIAGDHFLLLGKVLQAVGRPHEALTAFRNARESAVQTGAEELRAEADAEISKL